MGETQDILNRQVTEQIAKSEAAFQKNDIRNITALSLRYWISTRITGGEKNYLYKAYHMIVSALKETPQSLELNFFGIFLSIEMESYDKAEQMLDVLAKFKNYYKNNDSRSYTIYFFLMALLEVRQKRARPARKYIKIIEEYTEGSRDYLPPLVKGILSLEMYEYPQGYRYLTESYEKGCNSGLLFPYIFYYYNTAPKLSEKHELLAPFIKWGITHKAPIKRILDFYKDIITENFLNSALMAQKIYEEYKSEWIVKEICLNLMNENDMSLDALGYYKEAEHKQIPINGMNTFIVKSSYRNGVEDISRYTMEIYLKSMRVDIDLEIKAYVYHIILTNKKMVDLAENRMNEILQYCMYCLENNLKGRYYNSLYKYFIEVCETAGVYRSYLSRIQKAEDYLLDDLFHYEVSTDNKEIKYIWVYEKERKDMVLYKMTDGRTRVKASWEKFSYFCLSETKRNIIDEKLTVVKLIENADIWLYQYFYKKRRLGFELMLALAKNSLSLERHSDESKEILMSVLKYDEPSTAFKMQVRAVLGNAYYSEGDEKCLEYFKSVDENYLNDKYIEQMLIVFVNAGEYLNAVNLIVTKSYCISDKVLFYAVKKVSKVEEYNKRIADVCYKLLLKSWFDKELLRIVLDNYNASQDEWLDLAQALSSLSITEIALYELILKNSIWMHMLGSGVLNVFKKLYEAEPDNRIIEDFAYYCVYEMLINGYKPDADSIGILEKLYDKTGDKLLRTALCNVYIEHQVRTANSESLLKEAVWDIDSQSAEGDSLFFPIIKKIEDKTLITPYIEKSQPFLYKCLPGKNVFIYYKTEDEAEYRSKRMRYVRFGLYQTVLTHFFGEKLHYYFSEEMETGSISSKESVIYNTNIVLNEKSGDQFFAVNNALIYEQMFKYDQVDKIITEILKEAPVIKGRIL